MTAAVTEVVVRDGVRAWFTGRDPNSADDADVLASATGNLSHRRPHAPTILATERADAFAAMGLSPDHVHFMRQIHGAAVGRVEARTPPGAELRDVDALITGEPERALAVQTADCVPLLLASAGEVAAVHIGRAGLLAGVVAASVAAMNDSWDDRVAVIGPAIGGCCYELPDEFVDGVVGRFPEALDRTSWGTPSVDLSRAIESELYRLGLGDVRRDEACTQCDPDRRWFSHRRSSAAGRQLAVIVRST